MNGPAPHWTSSPLAAIHIEGARDATASAADRVFHLGTALGLVGAGEIEMQGVWEPKVIHLGAVWFRTERFGALSFEAALVVVERELAAVAGADDCDHCDRPECDACIARHHDDAEYCQLREGECDACDASRLAAKRWAWKERNEAAAEFEAECRRDDAMLARAGVR